MIPEPVLEPMPEPMPGSLRGNDPALVRPRTPTISECAVGQRLPGRSVLIDRAALIRYAGASLDRNPIHWDDEAAQRAGLPDVVAHGMLTMAHAVQVVGDWAGAERIVEYRARFTAPVPVPRTGGARLEVTGTIIAVGIGNDDGGSDVVGSSRGLVGTDPQSQTVVVELDVTCGGVPVLGQAQVTVDLSDSPR